VDAEGTVKKYATPRSPGTSTKRSQNAFAVTSTALSLGHLGPRLLGLPTLSLGEASGTLPRNEN